MTSPNRYVHAYIIPPGTSAGYYHSTSSGNYNWARVPPEIPRLSVPPTPNDVNPPAPGKKEIGIQTDSSLIQTDQENAG